MDCNYMIVLSHLLSRCAKVPKLLSQHHGSRRACSLSSPSWKPRDCSKDHARPWNHGWTEPGTDPTQRRNFSGLDDCAQIPHGASQKGQEMRRPFFITYYKWQPSIAWSRRTHWSVVVRSLSTFAIFFSCLFPPFSTGASWSMVCPYCWVVPCSDADPASSRFGNTICQGRLMSFFRCEHTGPSLLRTKSETKLRALLAAAFSALAFLHVSSEAALVLARAARTISLDSLGLPGPTWLLHRVYIYNYIYTL